MRWIATLLLTATLVFISSPAQADDGKLPLDKVPIAVKAAVTKRFPNAAIRGAGKETDNNKVVYELNLKDNGQNIDVIVTAEGTIETIEKEIAAKALPKVVADAVAAKYPKATYKKYEEVYKIKEGKETLEYYEVIIDTSEKKGLEVEITLEGKIKNKSFEINLTRGRGSCRASSLCKTARQEPRPFKCQLKTDVDCTEYSEFAKKWAYDLRQTAAWGFTNKAYSGS